MIHLKAWLVNDLVSVTLGPLALDTQDRPLYQGEVFVL